MVDVTPQQLEEVRAILAKHVAGLEVRAFGSRVTGKTRHMSDLDLAIVGLVPVDSRQLGLLREAFEESYLPFRVDVLDWNAISEEFRQIVAAKYEVVQAAM